MNCHYFQPLNNRMYLSNRIDFYFVFLQASKYSIICGGALIDPQWIVTTASCFYVNGGGLRFVRDTSLLSNYKIIAGDLDTQIKESREQERTPVEIHFHPGYRHAPYYENDIALVKLNQSVTQGPYVRTVCLPDSSIDHAKPGTEGTVAGWGKTRSGFSSTVLLHIALTIQTNTVCDQATHYFFNSSVTFCAGDGKGFNDTCQGDSGGSMVRNVLVDGKHRWVAVGLVSWGEGCAQKGKYGYYTRLHPFVDWIKNKISSSTSCPDPGAPKNGLRLDSNFKQGQSVRFVCDKDTKMIGNPLIVCNSGNWDNDAPRCDKDCGRLPTPQHGEKVEETNTTYLGRVTFQCKKKGYELRGSRKRVCRENGKWDGTLTTCEPVECSDPGKPRFGDRSPDLNKFIYDSKVQFICKTNYTLNGNKVITCKEDKQWTGSVPKCMQPCADPGIPNGGRRLQHSFLHGDKVTFSCNNGWWMKGERTITCNDGKWNYKEPKCLECILAFGMESLKIPNANIRASSKLSGNYKASYGRLNNNKAWCSSSNDKKRYLEIDLGKSYRITYLATQGSVDGKGWIKLYTVSHTIANSSLIDYREENKEKAFTGNNNAKSIVKHKVKIPFIAKKIRFNPIIFNKQACMRVEIYGCNPPIDCVMVGSSVLAKQNGVYFKSVLKIIAKMTVLVEKESEHKRDLYIEIKKKNIVLNVPNKEFDLKNATRVLAPWGNKYYTGKITKIGSANYGVVRTDSNEFKLFKKDEIRILKPSKFCL